MAATKVMKFWAICLAVLGKLLASLGVSAAATAARREAALYEAAAHTATPATATPATVPGAVPERDPGVVAEAARTGGALPLYGQAGPGLRAAAGPQLPPTIKQRIRAEAHGSSPTSRSRLATGAEPLHTVPAEAALHSESDAGGVPAAIPAARRRERHASYAV